MRDNNISPLREFFHNKYILAFLAIDLIAIIALVGVFVNRSTRVSTINFNVVPADATISVSGDKHYKNGQYDITPGTYKVEISHDGLETKSFSVDISPRNYVAVTVFLTDADKSFEYYTLNDNYESFKQLKAIASTDNNITTDKDTSAQDFIVEYNRKISIFEKLPIKGYVYTEPSVSMSTGGFAIESGRSKKECTKSACLIVKYYGKDYESEVTKKIQEAGYNPEDYEIIYERRTDVEKNAKN